jgi:hypothetical protein
MSHDVFISFAFKDQKAADCIRVHLVESGIKCFMCTDLPAGTGYDEALGKAIREAKILVLVLSPNSDDSHSVRNEVAIAKNRGKTIIPVRIEDFLPEKMEYSIATSLFFDAFPPPLEKHLPKLAKDIDTILNPPKSPEPSVEPKLKTSPIVLPPKQPPVRPGEWSEIDYRDLNDWVKERVRVLNSGKQLVARTFIYRKNRYTGKYERKLKTSIS